LSAKFSTSQLIRLALAVGLGLLVLLFLMSLLFVTDAAYDVWERLKASPDWFFLFYLAAFAGVFGAGGFMAWRLVRPRRTGKDISRQPQGLVTIDREAIDKRLEKDTEDGIDIAAMRRELALLEQRKAAGKIYVSFFGEISSGKSSLIKALLPNADLEVSVRGGTTREVGEYHWQSPSGDQLILIDMPGTNEVGAGLDEMARAEALRSHLVVYVCDGDLSRSQYDDLRALLDVEKPCIVVLNKTDRYRREELDLLLVRLRERVGKTARVELAAVQSGGRREVLIVTPDGREERQIREMPPRVDDLRRALQRHLDEDPEVLDRLRDTSVFVLVSQQLDGAEQVHRRERTEAITNSYTKKAMVGAMAAITPGSDLLIQGYLGISMVKELAKLYDVPVRKMDTDLLLELVQKKVARTTTIMLAVAGNALKSFPGIGTLAGGIAHAAAYGMIFNALGKAVSQSLESRGTLRPAQAAQVFEENLSEDLEASARRFAKLAIEIKRDIRRDKHQS